MRILSVLIVAGLLSGCASNKGLYEWGSYQPALVKYTKNNDAVYFEKELRETIAKAEKKKKMPPGIYAELGYLLMTNGKADEASEYFAMEKALFPESVTIMDKMIASANAGSKN